jgi:hypothetical protein
MSTTQPDFSGVAVGVDTARPLQKDNIEGNAKFMKTSPKPSANSSVRRSPGSHRHETQQWPSMARGGAVAQRHNADCLIDVTLEHHRAILGRTVVLRAIYRSENEEHPIAT